MIQKLVLNFMFENFDIFFENCKMYRPKRMQGFGNCPKTDN